MREPIQGYLDIDVFSPRLREREGWTRVGPVEIDFSHGDLGYLYLDGELPGTTIPRSSFFTIDTDNPARMDRAIELRLSVPDLGRLAFARWNDEPSLAKEMEVGRAMVRALSLGDEYFWELPAGLMENMYSDGVKVAEGFIAVLLPRSGNFIEAQLGLLFRYRSDTTPSGDEVTLAQIDDWISRVCDYTLNRGLTETLMAMLGENRPLSEIMGTGTEELPLPDRFTRPKIFKALLPDNLRIGAIIHGAHQQIELPFTRTDVRVAVNRENGARLASLLNQSGVAHELMEHGFSVQFVRESPDFLPRGDRTGDFELLSKLLPDLTTLEAFNAPLDPEDTESAPSYWGPYLHFSAEHDGTVGARGHAMSGILLLVYHFRDFLTGLRNPYEDLEYPK